LIAAALRRVRECLNKSLHLVEQDFLDNSIEGQTSIVRYQAALTASNQDFGRRTGQELGGENSLQIS
jgi:hypothetical protein